MATNSKIEWTDHTANLWWGCTKVHAGCDNCYAETLSHRWGNTLWGNTNPRKEIKSAFADLDRFQRMAKEAGVIHRVFVGSMMDIFEKPMPLVDSKGKSRSYTTEELRELLFMNIDFGKYPNLMFLLLTKRPSNINKYIPDHWKAHPPTNVMFGTSPVDQTTFYNLTAQLTEINGKRFLSIEPQLGKITVLALTGRPGTIHWIIQGGESGHHRRPFDLAWAYSLRQECKKLRIPYFFKQIDKVRPIPEDLLIREFPI